MIVGDGICLGGGKHWVLVFVGYKLGLGDEWVDDGIEGGEGGVRGVECWTL